MRGILLAQLMEVTYVDARVRCVLEMMDIWSINRLDEGPWLNSLSTAVL